MMVAAVRAAAADAECPALLNPVDSVRVIRGMWPYENPAKSVAEAIGSPNAETGISTWGGNSVQSVLSTSALEIQRGNAAHGGVDRRRVRPYASEGTSRWRRTALAHPHRAARIAASAKN